MAESLRQRDDDDDDGGVAGSLRLTSVTFPAFESSGEAAFVVERIGGSDGEVTVDYATIDGSAAAGEDNLAAEGTLVWRAGESAPRRVTVPLIDDEESEGLETITVVLTRATGGAELGMRDAGSIVIIDDDGGPGGCVPDDETLCLGAGRFQVTGAWRDFDGNEGPFHVVPASDGSGLIWFFDPANVEILLKVLDGCGLNDRYWVFSAATTNVEYTLRVEDLLRDVVRTYHNPLGTAAPAITDTSAFATCP